ncbi:MAG: hypothetical protein IKI11_00905 [Neisseriaceae bacterium]|nr:hypothetical protein [Neisseriaceae bacterium]
MEMFIHIALFLLGVFLIWNGINSLKKLKENNLQWTEIERKYYLYKNGNQSVIDIKINDIKTMDNIKDKQQMVNAMRDDILLYNKYEDNYIEAENIVNKLKKIIPFFAKFSVFDGVCCMLFLIFSIFIKIDTNYLLEISVIMLMLFMAMVFIGFLGNDMNFNAQLIKFSSRYNLLITYFSSSKYNDIKTIEQLFNNYLSNLKWYSGFQEVYYENSIKYRIILLSLFYLGFLIFSFVLSFDKKQVIMFFQ